MQHLSNTTMTISIQQPAWTHEEGVQFECAREVITDLMGILSAQIATTTAPDALAALRARRSALAQERARLKVADHDDIARIREGYGRIVHEYIASVQGFKLQ